MEERVPAAEPPAAFRIGCVAFLTGGAVMVVELAAVRLLAPSFGDSAPVWTNVIAVILLALACGAGLGGRLADRGGGGRMLAGLLASGAALLFAAPFVAPRLSAWILPPDLTLGHALPVLIEGSLAVSLVVFAPPVVLAGMVPPLLIRLVGRPGTVGRAAGLVYAAGTAGSLAGTFAATHLLVPQLGLKGTFTTAGVLLFLAALLGWGGRPSPRVSAALLPLFLLVPPEPRPGWAGHGRRILARRDSRYQRGRPARLLGVNEVLDSFQSFYIPGSAFTGGRYYDAFGLLAAALRRRPLRVLSLGCAAGTILRVLWATAGAVDGVGVELDPVVLRLGRRYLGTSLLERAGVRLLAGVDARVYTARMDRVRRFDLICLDAYRDQIYLPPHLCTREFFETVKARLAAGGLFAVNVGDLRPEGPVVRAVAGTLASVFATVETLPVPHARNVLVVAHDGRPGRLARAIRAWSPPPGFPHELWERARRSGAWRRLRARDAPLVLTDDHAPVFRLQEEAYRAGRRN